jgi:hypothetical protein
LAVEISKLQKEREGAGKGYRRAGAGLRLPDQEERPHRGMHLFQKEEDLSLTYLPAEFLLPVIVLH